MNALYVIQQLIELFKLMQLDHIVNVLYNIMKFKHLNAHVLIKFIFKNAPLIV